MPEQIKIRREGAVEIIEFYNPPMNFMTGTMLKELYHECRRLIRDDSVRAVILTGGIKDAFIAHYDVAELVKFSHESVKMPKLLVQPMMSVLRWLQRRADKYPWIDEAIMRSIKSRPAMLGLYMMARSFDLLDTMPKPVIAAINGMATGGACELSLVCDYRFMARGELYRIGLPEVLVGIIPGGVGTLQRLPRVIGEAKALEMVLTGTIYTPDEAEAIGLINRAVEPSDLMPTAMELAQRLARGAPCAIAGIRRAIRQGSRMSFECGRVIEIAVSQPVMETADAIRGMSKYVERLSAYSGMDLPAALATFEDLRAGRMVKYEGK